MTRVFAALRKQYLTIAVVLTCFLFLLSTWYLYQQATRLQRLLEEQAQSNRLLQSQGTKLAERRAQLVLRREKEKEEAAHVLLRLPTSADQPALLAEISRAALHSRLTIVRLTTQADAPLPGNGRQVPVELTLRGLYSNVRSFFGALASTTRFVTIRALTIRRMENESSGLVEVHLSLLTYYLPEDNQSPALGLPQGESTVPLGKADPFAATH
ncbi:MAG TPA: type 4a pilus biogenesis protein PilO [Firmicutes bacterium]|nr:type 4a pilus biogenesis protein PilO [Bacillota bacterium]